MFAPERELLLRGRSGIAALLLSAIPLMSVADPNGMSTFLEAVASFADAFDIQFHEPLLRCALRSGFSPET
jgi:hypothetical protein